MKTFAFLTLVHRIIRGAEWTCTILCERLDSLKTDMWEEID
jgi:hypothetical protein